MALEWFVASLIGLAIFVYFYLTWNYSYWSKRGITQLQPLPGVGIMTDVIRFKKGILHVESDIYKKFAGHKVVGYYRFRQPVLMLRDPEIIKTVLIKYFSRFHENYTPYNTNFDAVFTRDLFFTEGQAWRTMRLHLAAVFSVSKLRQLFPAVNNIFNDLNKYLDSHIDEYINVTQMTCMFGIDNIARIAFGLEGTSFTSNENYPHQWLYKIMEDIQRNTSNQFLLLSFVLFPRLAQLFKLRFFPKYAVDYLEMVIKQTEEYREEYNIKRDDFLQTLLSMKKKSETNNDEEYTTNDAAKHCLLFLFDSIQTNLVTQYALYELAINHGIQEKLREELQSATSKGSIDYEALMNLRYLDKIVSETLRLYTGFSENKVCIKATTLEVDGKLIHIEEGTVVSIPAYNIHHDPEYYENPEEFDPERFSEEKIASNPTNIFLSFGAGPRMCVGIKFALMQVKCFLYHIVLNYRLLCIKNTVDRPYPDLLSKAIKPDSGVWIKFEKYIQ